MPSSLFSRIYSSRQCAKCGDVLRCDDLVMRWSVGDLIFHLNCFCCALCKVPLNSGDTAALQDGQLFCGEHVGENRLGQMQSMNEDATSQSFYCASPQKGRPRKRKCSPHTPGEIGLQLTHPSLLLLDPSGGGHSSEVGTELRLGKIFVFYSIESSRLLLPLSTSTRSLARGYV